MESRWGLERKLKETPKSLWWKFSEFLSSHHNFMLRVPKQWARRWAVKSKSNQLSQYKQSTHSIFRYIKCRWRGKTFPFSCLDSIFVGEKVSSEKAETIVEVNRLWSGDNTASNKRFPAALFSFHCDDIVAAKKRLNLLWKSDINYTLRRCIKLEEGSRCDVHFKRQLNYWGWEFIGPHSFIPRLSSQLSAETKRSPRVIEF